MGAQFAPNDLASVIKLALPASPCHAWFTADTLSFAELGELLCDGVVLRSGLLNSPASFCLIPTYIIEVKFNVVFPDT